MSDLPQRLNALSPAKQALLQQRLLAAQRTADPIPRRDANQPAPLSFAQEGLCFLHRLDPESCAYLIPQAFRLRGLLHPAALQESFRLLLARHETLRARFLWHDGLPVQELAAPASFDLPVVVLSAPGETDRQHELQRLTEAWVAQPFDLAAGPLLRAQLIQVAPTEHLLLLNIHHIVFDGWSQSVLAEELSALYSAILDSNRPLPPALPLQYPDYAAWQRGHLTGASLARLLEYWRNRLADVPTLDLPTDHARPARQSYRGARYDFKLSPHLAVGLQDFNQREGVTSFMSLLTAFQVLLMRCCNQLDVVVGVPVANRQRPELERLIGFFVNLLALRADLPGHRTFREAVQQGRTAVLEAFQHQDLPFEHVVEGLRLARDPGCHPVFQVVFAFQNTPEPGLDLAGLTATPYPLPTHSTRFDLELHLQPEAAGLTGTIYFNTDLFAPESIARLATCFQILLTGALAEPDRPIAELPLVSPAERQRVLLDWNATAAEYPRDKCVHQLFEAQVERTPDAIAVECDGQALTYHQLNQRANQLAHHLQALGVGPEVLVAICVERSLELLIGLLAILKAGGAYVPLDPNYPKSRLGFILNDAQPLILLTETHLAAGLALSPCPTLCLDTIALATPAANPTTATRPSNLAYVIYTSGSTGQPKGVAIEHRGLANLCCWHLQTYAVDQTSRVSQIASLSFDASVWEIWPALVAGATLCLSAPHADYSPPQLHQWLEACRITHCFLPTPLAELFLTNVPVPPRHLRILLTGGDRLLHQPSADLPFAFFNHYGPTESTVVTTACRVPPLSADSPAAPIGRAIANTQTYILDEHRQPVPVGVAGELYIGGDGLARGYLNQPELTAQKFVPDPFSNTPGARLYRTGDRCRYLPDGNIEFLGRLDHQIKLRGFRIELGEIEAVLSTHPDLHSAVVLLREDQPGNKFLAAYFVSRVAPSPTTATLREFLKTKLPDYMIPAAFVSLPALPLTPNGKVDRKALPAPTDLNQLIDQTSFVPPRTDTEAKLAAIWEELLGVPQISIQDNFFDLGGHSLLAVRLQDRLEKEFGGKLSLVTIFQHPNLETLANHIQLPTSNNPQPGIFSLTGGAATPELYFIINETSLGLLPLARSLRHHPSLFASSSPLPRLALAGTAPDKTQPPQPLEVLAALHVEQIHRQQGYRPCLLAGHCFSGILAFEIAHQLQRAGTPVAGVLMLDSWMKSPGKLWWRQAWLRTHLKRTLTRGPGYLVARLQNRRAIGDLRKATPVGEGEFDILPGGILPAALEKFCQESLSTYRPQPLLSRGVLLISREDWAAQAYRGTHPALGAESCFVQGLKTIEVPGDHVTVLKESNLPALATVFQDWLAEFRTQRI